MESTKKRWLLVSLLVFILLVSTVHGAQLADATAPADSERTTVRTGAAGHAGHGYSSHSGVHPNGDTPQQGGAGVVDPRNLAARSHHRNGAASRAIGYSSLAICAFAGAIVLV